MIINDSCGFLAAGATKRSTLNAQFTATTTGPLDLEFNNWREGVYSPDIHSYIDNVSVYPQNPVFLASPFEVSVSAGGIANLELDPGAGFSGQDYLVLTGLTGTYPGFPLKGVHVPLNFDVVTTTAFSLINTPVMQNFLGTLDGNGQATAVFSAFGLPSPAAIGLALYFDALVYRSTGGPPVELASNPIYVFFLP